MSTNLTAKRYARGLNVEGKTIQQRKVVRTTLGELIVAVTDEVRSIIRDRSGLSMVVSYILNDLLAHHQVHVQKRSRRKPASLSLVH
jgi:hypothetical protein